MNVCIVEVVCCVNLEFGWYLVLEVVVVVNWNICNVFCVGFVVDVFKVVVVSCVLG